MNEMTDLNETKHFEIKIEGHLCERRARNFESFQVTQLPNGKTLIAGEIKDQSELFGVLIRIRDMGISLLSLNYKPSEIIQPLGDSS
jgi:hypothetical protein